MVAQNSNQASSITLTLWMILKQDVIAFSGMLPWLVTQQQFLSQLKPAQNQWHLYWNILMLKHVKSPSTESVTKSDISYLKTSRAFDVLIHSRALLAAILCW